MELHELGVTQPRAGLDGKPHRVAVVLVATRRGVPPDPGVTACSQDDCIRMDDVSASVREVEAIGPEHRSVLHQEPGDVHAVENLDLQRNCPVSQGSLDFEPGVVAGERRAPIAMRAEVALRDPPVGLTVEVHAVPLQVVDALGGSLGDDLDGVWVRQEIALLDRVGGVLLPGVLGIHGCQRRVDAAGRERGVRVLRGPLADGEDLHPSLRQLDGCPETRSSGPDHQDRGRESMLHGWRGHARLETRTALIVCIRFAACSNTSEAADEKTSSVTSAPRRP